MTGRISWRAYITKNSQLSVCSKSITSAYMIKSFPTQRSYVFSRLYTIVEKYHSSCWWLVIVECLFDFTRIAVVLELYMTENKTHNCSWLLFKSQSLRVNLSLEEDANSYQYTIFKLWNLSALWKWIRLTSLRFVQLDRQLLLVLFREISMLLISIMMIKIYKSSIISLMLMELWLLSQSSRTITTLSVEPEKITINIYGI